MNSFKNTIKSNSVIIICTTVNILVAVFIRKSATQFLFEKNYADRSIVLKISLLFLYFLIPTLFTFILYPNFRKRIIDFGKKTREINPGVFVLIIVIFSALIIRLIGLRYGFPLLTHPGESTIIDPVIRMTRRHTFNPGTFNRPNQILYLLNYVYLNVFSYIYFGKNIAKSFAENQLSFYYMGRLLICIMGTIIPYIAYKIGKEFSNDFSIPASFLFAFFPPYAFYSHYLSPDIPITLFTLLVMLFTIKYTKSRNSYFIYLATIFSAVNTAEKYPGLLSLSIVFVGILTVTLSNEEEITSQIGDFFRSCIKVFGIYLLSLFIVAPNLFIHYKEVIEIIVYESRSTHLGADNLGWGGNLLFYISTFVSFSNLISIFLIPIGLFEIIRNREKGTIILFYSLFYWITMSKLALHWERWALPMYISPLFLIASGMSYLWKISRETNLVKYFTLVILSVLVFHQFVFSLYNSISFTFPDNRLVAKRFCNDHGITKKNSYYEGYTPFRVRGFKELFDADLSSKEKEYIILSSYTYERYFNEEERYSKEVNFYNQVRENNTLIQEINPSPIPENTGRRVFEIIYFFGHLFSTEPLERTYGPTIQIYEITK